KRLRETQMASIGQEIYRKFWPNGGPFTGFPTRLFEADLQGWNSEHHFFFDTIASLRPQIIVKIGVWKGASCVSMARTVKMLDLDAAIVAIDTWLGSWEHWLQPQWLSE